MSKSINREFWSKVLVRKENGEPDYEATKADLKAFLTLLANDQEKVGEALKGIFQGMPSHEHIRKPDALFMVCHRIAPNDMGLWDALKERAAEVVARDYKVNRHCGIVNPFYVEPPPDSRTKAASGNVR